MAQKAATEHLKVAIDLARSGQTDHLFCGDAALLQHEDPIGERDGLVHIVGHEQHGRIVGAPQLQHQFVHLDAGQGVERRKGLIQQQEFGFADQGPRERRPLRLAPRQRGGPGFDPVAQAHLAQGCFRPAADIAAAKAQSHIAPHPLPRHQPGVLEHHGPRLWHSDLIRRRRIEARQGAQKRGLA